MKSADVNKRMRRLEAEIRHHQFLYYVEHSPEISDRDFDRLFAELQELEAAYPDLASPDSPTRMVGSDLDNEFPKFQHTVPVLSLGNTYSTPEALEWARKQAQDRQTRIGVQWKVDGATLVLYYEQGRLIRAVTRGSGQVGDEVTANALTIRSIPHVLRSEVDLVARGEVYMTFEDFANYNEQFGSVYANPRNLAAGTLKHKKSSAVAARPLRWVAFDGFFPDGTGAEGQTIAAANENNVSVTVALQTGQAIGSDKKSNRKSAKKTEKQVKKKSEKITEQKDAKKAQSKKPQAAQHPQFEFDADVLAELKRLGLPVLPDSASVEVDRLENTIRQFEKRRNEMPMPVDGLVLKIDRLVLRKELGQTANSPRWATALKFEPEIQETTVKKIEVFVGRTGRVTPRAELEPVKLAGTTVTYATLHNADFIEKLGVRVGSRVKVSKRGEIIPAVEEVVDPGKGRPFKFPTACPSCGSPLKRAEDAVDWMCLNALCPEKMQNAISFFAGRKQMDINGMGEKVCRILYERGFIRDIADIYELHKHRSDLENVEGFGQKSVQILLDGIEESKKRPFRYVLPSLGLREVGHNVTEILIQSGYDNMNALLKLARAKDAAEQLTAMDGIGPRTAEAFVEQFRNPAVQKIIERLGRAGLQMAAKKQLGHGAAPADQIFAGQTWCVTGSFESFKPRDRAMDEIKARGGKTVGSVSSRTTHLLAGESAGSKLDKARELGVQVVSEAEFKRLLDSGS